MSSYQTGRFAEYSTEFVDVADRLANLLQQRQTAKPIARFEGSYSIISPNTGETSAKILIFQQGVGRENPGPLALRNEGVYILTRRNGTIGPTIQASGFQMLSRTHPVDNIGVTPKRDERFGFFPVMAGENFQNIVDFLAQVSFL
ncbi:MAG TPA: hypothetical protein VFQ41_09315 [Candidatus Angelobacter sp.]|nr:hypothetical protein [Candidatus Angelobacter sp.]